MNNYAIEAEGIIDQTQPTPSKMALNQDDLWLIFLKILDC